MNQNIKEYLNHYITLDNPQYAVLLKGEWGCGKTHFIKQLIEEWNKNDVSDNDGIVLKPIYVSLNGISKIETVNNRIKEALNPFLNSAIMKFGNKIFKGLVKSTIKVDLDSTSDDDDKYSMSFEINPFSFLSSDSKDIKGNKVLVFDDVERCKINIDELFGYINNFVAHLSCKVILIGDESKIEQLYDAEGNELNRIHYKDFKEKLVGQTFLIKKNIDDAIEQFISDIRKNASEDYISLLELNISFIKELFEKTETHNLRILRQSFLDLNRFLEFLPDQYKEEEQYPLYMKSVLAYFILTYCEYKSGNRNIINFQNWSFRLGENKDTYAIYIQKYDHFLDNNKIMPSDYIVSLQTISHYIGNGVISDLELQDLLILKKDFFTKKEIELWEQLRDHYEINNNEFDAIYKRVKNEFYRGKIDNVSRLLPIIAVLLIIDSENIVKLNRVYFVRKAKNHIDAIIKKQKKINKQKMLIVNKGWYLSRFTIIAKDKDFLDIYQYIIDQNEQIRDTTMKDYFESITDQTILRLSDITSEGLPDQSKPYYMTPIFKDVSAKKFTNKFILLNNEHKRDLIFFLKRRYYLENSGVSGKTEQYLIDDLNSLQNIKKELEPRIRRTKLIDKFCLKEMINVLDQVILKLEPIKDIAKELGCK